MDLIQMPRRRISVSVDAEVLDLLAERAIELNTSVSRLVETALITFSKDTGLLSEDYRPLGETRGGNRINTEEAE